GAPVGERQPLPDQRVATPVPTEERRALPHTTVLQPGPWLLVTDFNPPAVRQGHHPHQRTIVGEHLTTLVLAEGGSPGVDDGAEQHEERDEGQGANRHGDRFRELRSHFHCSSFLGGSSVRTCPVHCIPPLRRFARR